MFSNVWASGICVVLGIVVFMVLCYMNVHTGIAAIIAAVIAAFGSSNTIAVSLLDTFPTGVGALITQQFFVFTVSGLLAYLMDKTGAAMSVGKTMVKWFGVERSWLAISITTVILLVAGVGTYTMVVVVLAIPLMKAANLPRKVGLVAAYGIAPAISFCMPVSNVPGSLPSTFLPNVGIYSAPLLSVACGVLGIVLFLLWITHMVRVARKNGEGFDGDHNVGEVDTDTSDLPSFATSVIPLAVVVIAAILMAALKFGTNAEGMPVDFAALTGIDSTNQVAVAQLCGVIAVVILHFKRCKSEGFGKILSQGATSMWGFLMLAGCVFGFGQVVSTCSAFNSLREWVLDLQLNPYVTAMISIMIIAFICADGIAAMMIWGPMFGAEYVDMGVDPGALRRLLLCTSQTFDDLPHAQSTAITLGMYGLTIKQAYKDMFVSATVIPLIFSIFCCVCCIIFYPIG